VAAPDLRPVPFHTLPLNATMDRVVGSLHWEHALQHGAVRLQRGLLADANGGVLYVDEVNLLDEDVVSALLDAAESGVNRVQREGVQAWHPAAFLLMGTMNTEEGPLRPQLLDRFGLVVDVSAEQDIEARKSVIRRRLAFEADPTAFRAQWADEQKRLRADIDMVRKRLHLVQVPAAVMQEITELCTTSGVAGHRADILLAEAARARAAWEGDTIVTGAHVNRVRHFVLLHRARGVLRSAEGDVPTTGSGNGPSAEPEQKRKLKVVTPETGAKDEEAVGASMTSGCNSQVGQMFRSEGEHSDSDESPVGGQCTGEDDGEGGAIDRRGQRTAPLRSAVSPIAQGMYAAHLLQMQRRKRTKVSGSSGRRAAGASSSKRGRYHRAQKNEEPTDLAVDATIRAAAVRTGLEGSDSESLRVQVKARDLHQKIRRQRTKALILFVVDASGSLGEEVMSLSKGATLALLRDAYQKRDRVALIAFRDYSAPLLLPPTNSVDLGRRCLADLATGGRTPLAGGLVTAYKTIEQVRRRDRHAPVMMVLLSDGRANISLHDMATGRSVYHGGGDAHVWNEVLRIGDALGRLEGVDIVCVDTTPTHKPPSLLCDLAAQMRGRYVLLEHLEVGNLLSTMTSAPIAERRERIVRMWK